jgi:hypothetical protein
MLHSDLFLIACQGRFLAAAGSSRAATVHAANYFDCVTKLTTAAPARRVGVPEALTVLLYSSAFYQRRPHS